MGAGRGQAGASAELGGLGLWGQSPTSMLPTCPTLDPASHPPASLKEAPVHPV